jgi:zinc/manganese transport system ATP-binding protein/zinc transport system ATP-binding protein
MSHTLLALQRVSAAYAGQPVFTDLDLCLTPGQFAALVGPTGGGKSTLLKLILGLLPCTQGRMQRPPQVTMGYVPQREMIDWRFPVTAEQVVLMGRYRHTSYWPWATRADRREVAALLNRLGLAPYARRHIRELSGGQQQRVFLARALVARPQLLLLDEPTTGVDLRTQHDILHLLHELNREGMTILLATHDLNTIASHVPWVICFQHGVIAQGPPETVLTPELLRQTYNADLVVLRQDGMTFIANRSLTHSHVAQQGALAHRPRRVSDGVLR